LFFLKSFALIDATDFLEAHMKQTIISAILALCFMNAAVFAQTGGQKILVPGNPALTNETVDKSADFFQWALGGNFTAEEFNEYRQHLVRVWKQNDSGSIKVIGEIAAMRDKLVGYEPEKLKTLIPQLQTGLLKELRAQLNDPLSIVLLKMYDRSRNLDVKQDGNLPAPSQATNNTVDISQFVGEWEENYGGNSNHSTGSGSGTVRSSDQAKYIVRFYSDGTYKSAFINRSIVADCNFTISYIGVGVSRFDANTLYMNEQTRREISSSCFPTDNYDKETKAGNYAYPWQIGRDENGLKLVLTVNGKPHVFYKIEGKGVFGG
jgi:hypothetical protein